MLQMFFHRFSPERCRIQRLSKCQDRINRRRQKEAERNINHARATVHPFESRFTFCRYEASDVRFALKPNCVCIYFL